MDGMRKIPDNVPDRAFLEPYLQMPLTVVPNPFGGDYESFGHHNNAMLRRFLDTFGFDYEFASATDYYKSGRFDAALLRAGEVRRHHEGDAADAGRRAAGHLQPLPADLAEERPRALRADEDMSTPRPAPITFDDEDGEETTLPVTGGKVKLQWKPDFGMRWAALGVDFEMFGKDHQTNAASTTGSARSSAGARRSISSTNFSSTRTARRSRSRRATA
jgi:lysyl-tRNA synthetase class 1